MTVKVFLVAGLLSGVVLLAQSPDPQATQQESKRSVYVRRLSGGLTLSVLGLSTVPKRTDNSIVTTPPIDALYTVKNASKRIGYGGQVQLAVTERFAVNAGFFVRSVGYKLNSDVILGSNPPGATTDTRTHTVTNEDTRARFYDIPVTVRYYFKDRHEKGIRGFVEAGGALRQISHLKTSVDSTINSGTTTCCDTTPTRTHHTVRGAVVGAGMQFIDPFGIRVIPEFRYTRWLSNPFTAPSVLTQRNQIEAMISLSF